MTIAFLNQSDAFITGDQPSGTAVAIPFTPTIGSRLCFILKNTLEIPFTGVSDNQTIPGTYVRVYNSTDNNGVPFGFWISDVLTSVPTTFSPTWSGGLNAIIDAFAIEFSGADGTYGTPAEALAYDITVNTTFTSDTANAGAIAFLWCNPGLTDTIGVDTAGYTITETPSGTSSLYALTNPDLGAAGSKNLSVSWPTTAGSTSLHVLTLNAASVVYAVTGVLGTATANGFTATVNSALTITAALGTATANGLTATIGLGTTNIIGVFVTDNATNLTVSFTTVPDLSAGTIGFAFSVNGLPPTSTRFIAGSTYSQSITVPLTDLGASGGDTIYVDAGYSLTDPPSTWVWAIDEGTAYTAHVVGGAGAAYTVNTGTGAATASGFLARVDRQYQVTATLGTATASGFLAAWNGLNVSAALATAVASGFNATIDKQINISGSLGTALADGFLATLSPSNYSNDDLMAFLVELQAQIAAVQVQISALPTTASIAALPTVAMINALPTAASIAALPTVAMINALPTASEIAIADGAYAIEGTYTRDDVLRIKLAELVGDATVPSGDGAYVFNSTDGLKQRIAGTISGSTRTVTTKDGTL